ncbi:hypothetical protein PLESTF_000524200 [Pleodorina starrii]|nr:hypothetical protein PLESTF_000524200 [Pleodorina starrii]
MSSRLLHAVVATKEWLFILNPFLELNWEQYKTFCKQNGADLVPMRETDSQEALTQLCGRQGLDCWFGGQQRGDYCPLYSGSSAGSSGGDIVAARCATTQAFAVCAVKLSSRDSERVGNERESPRTVVMPQQRWIRWGGEDEQQGQQDSEMSRPVGQQLFQQGQQLLQQGQQQGQELLQQMQQQGQQALQQMQQQGQQALQQMQQQGQQALQQVQDFMQRLG